MCRAPRTWGSRPLASSLYAHALAASFLRSVHLILWPRTSPPLGCLSRARFCVLLPPPPRASLPPRAPQPATRPCTPPSGEPSTSLTSWRRWRSSLRRNRRSGERRSRSWRLKRARLHVPPPTRCVSHLGLPSVPRARGLWPRAAVPERCSQRLGTVRLWHQRYACLRTARAYPLRTRAPAHPLRVHTHPGCSSS